jgi:hypothetical protein
MNSSIHTPALVYTASYHFSPQDLTIFTALSHSFSSPIVPATTIISNGPSRVAPLETGRCDRRPGFDDLDLLDTSLKLECIKLFVAQAVMSDCEEHFYDGALQGFIDVARFHESCVSIDSRGTCHEIVLHGFEFFFGIGHFLVSVSITGVRSGLPSVVERESHAGTLPSLRPPSLSRSAR